MAICSCAMFFLLIFTWILGKEDMKAAQAITDFGTFTGDTVTFENYQVDVFFGIPFAEVPVGPLRFKPPISWKKIFMIYNARNKKYPCSQNTLSITRDYVIDSDNSTEDCLHVNIWVPKPWCTSRHSNCPLKTVIVFFPGLFFNFGGNSYRHYDAHVLAALGDVVVVVPNYRLNIFGFLDAKIPEAPGNVGLYDQVMAMHWVKNNIEHFGGDKDNIVLFGHGAGAEALGYNMVSPMGARISKRMILVSGSPYSITFWSTCKSDDHFRELSIKLKCLPENEINKTLTPKIRNSLVSCINQRKKTQILSVTDSIILKYCRPTWGNRFLPEHPIKQLESKTPMVPEILLGNTMNEGRLAMSVMFHDPLRSDHGLTVEEALPEVERKYHDLIPSSNLTDLVMRYQPILKNERSTQFFFFFNHFLGDTLYICPLRYLADTLSKNTASRVYYYVFDAKESHPVFTDVPEPTHHDDITFVFGQPLLKERSSRLDKELSRRMIKLFTNFAKGG